MRVALVILHAEAARGGAERYTLQLAAALAARGQEVTLPCASACGELPAGVRSVTLDHRGLTRSTRYRAFCRALATHLAENSYDIVHAMLPVPPGLCDLYHPHAGVAAARSEAWLAWWSNPRRRLFARVERRMLSGPRPPVVLTLSQYVEDELRRHYPALPAAAMERLFNAVDLERFRPDGPAADRRELGAEDGDVLALFVGNDFIRKGLDLTLAEMLDGHDPLPTTLKLAVAGEDARYGRGARRMAHFGGIADRVRFLGRRRDLPELYRAADFLVLPTRHDPCSLVVLESLACGLPVISTRQNGATEIMRDGEHGFVLESQDDPRLRAAMRQMLDPDLRRRMRSACIGLRPALSWDRHVETLLAIYARTADRDSQAA